MTAYQKKAHHTKVFGISALVKVFLEKTIKINFRRRLRFSFTIPDNDDDDVVSLSLLTLTASVHSQSDPVVVFNYD